MARPKGSKNTERNENKYWLPEGISLKDGQTNYNKETKLIFIDSQYGEFTSTFRHIQRLNNSAHPDAVYDRQIERVNNLAKPEFRKKAQDTMEEKYGVRNALQSEVFLKKSQDTLEKNYGVRTPMKSKEIKDTIKRNNIEKFGVDNVMKVDEIKERQQDSLESHYGVRNPIHSPELREKMLKTITDGEKFISAGEIEIREFIESLGLKTKSSYIGGANPKQIDIKIEDRNIAIEYNGCYWHSEANKNMYNSYHIEKTELAAKQGLRLLHIFDYEWIKRRDQIKSFLRSALGKNEINVYGRNTTVESIPRQEADKFLNDYHILGKCSYIEAIGLRSKEGELLAMITIGRHHRNNTEVVLSRYVGKENITVVGGLSKLVANAISKYGTITTWIDLRFSTGESWIKSGWTLQNKLKPDYFYYDAKFGKIVSKQSRKKSVVHTPEGMTEHEHALKDGLYRVYDCGKLKLTIG